MRLLELEAGGGDADRYERRLRCTKDESALSGGILDIVYLSM